MKKVLWCLAALSFLGGHLFGQEGAVIVGPADVDQLSRYSVTCAIAAGSKCSVAVTASNTKRLYLEYVVVRSSAAAAVTFEWGGTAPTTTAITSDIQKRNTANTSVAAAYTASNAGAGVMSRTMGNLVAGVDQTYDMRGEGWANKTAWNITVSAASGTGQIVFFWAEK